MNKADLLNMAWHNLLRHKGRTFLTVLGVMIGVTAIIVMISLALGLTASMTSMVAANSIASFFFIISSFDTVLLHHLLYIFMLLLIRNCICGIVLSSFSPGSFLYSCLRLTSQHIRPRQTQQYHKQHDRGKCIDLRCHTGL